jgi:hypothetical protein
MKKTLLTVLLSAPFLLLAQSGIKELKMPENGNNVATLKSHKAIDLSGPVGQGTVLAMLSAHLTHYEYFPSIYPLHLAE